MPFTAKAYLPINISFRSEGVVASDLQGERGKDWADAVTYARQNGAVGVIVLPSKFLQENWDGLRQQFGRTRYYVEKLAAAPPAASTTTAAMPPMPSIFVASREVTESIFNGETANPLSGNANTAFDLNASKKINFNISPKSETVMTQPSSRFGKVQTGLKTKGRPRAHYDTTRATERAGRRLKIGTARTTTVRERSLV